MKADYSKAYAPPDLSTERGKAFVAGVKQLLRMEKEPAGRIVLDFIVNDLCRTYDQSYRPDEKGGDRDTVFAEGRRFVGLQIERVIKTGFDKLTK